MQDVAERPGGSAGYPGDEFGGLHRTIDWKGAFWIASGVPALVLISIGGLGATVGKLAFLVWTISVVIGLFQAYSYAEIYSAAEAAAHAASAPVKE